MKKIITDFIFLFIICFIYISLNDNINISYFEGIVISLGISGVFSLLGEIIRNLNEENLRSKKEVSLKEIEQIRKIRLVVRDSIMTFVLCYGVMTATLGGIGISFLEAIPFVIASIAPTLVVAAVSKEMRMPTEREQVELNLNKIA